MLPTISLLKIYIYNDHTSSDSLWNSLPLGVKNVTRKLLLFSVISVLVDWQPI